MKQSRCRSRESWSGECDRCFGGGSGRARSERGDRGSEEGRGVRGDNEDEEEVKEVRGDICYDVTDRWGDSDGCEGERIDGTYAWDGLQFVWRLFYKI